MASISSANLAKFEQLTQGCDFYPRFVFTGIEQAIHVTDSFFGGKYKNEVNKVEKAPVLQEIVETLDLGKLHFNSHLNAGACTDTQQPSVTSYLVQSPMKVSLKVNRDVKARRQSRKAAAQMKENKMDKENQHVNYAPKASSKGTGLGNGKGAGDKQSSIRLQHTLLPLAEPRVFQAQYEDGGQRLETIFTENFRNVQFSPTSSNSNSMRNAYQSHHDTDGIPTPSDCHQYQSNFAKKYCVQQKKDRLTDEEYMRVIANDYSECKAALAESDSESYQPLR